MRGAMELRARHRAVTAEDFEYLARKASPRVAPRRLRAARRGQRGRRADPAARAPGRPPPGVRRAAAVARPARGGRRSPRRAPPARRHAARRAGPPARRQRRRRAADRAARRPRPHPRADAARAVPLPQPARRRHAGRLGEGWEFGRTLNQGELYGVVHRIAGVEYVRLLRMYRADLVSGRQSPEPAGSHIVLEPDETIASGCTSSRPRCAGRSRRDGAAVLRALHQRRARRCAGRRARDGVGAPAPAQRRPDIYRRDARRGATIRRRSRCASCTPSRRCSTRSWRRSTRCRRTSTSTSRPSTRSPGWRRWLGVDEVESLPAAQRREAVRRAGELARLRGTRAGLQLALGLFFPDITVRINDHGGVVVSESADEPPPPVASFDVVCEQSLPPETQMAVARCIEHWKPVHAHYKLRVRRGREVKTLPTCRPRRRRDGRTPPSCVRRSRPARRRPETTVSEGTRCRSCGRRTSPAATSASAAASTSRGRRRRWSPPFPSRRCKTTRRARAAREERPGDGDGGRAGGTGAAATAPPPGRGARSTTTTTRSSRPPTGSRPRRRRATRSMHGSRPSSPARGSAGASRSTRRSGRTRRAGRRRRHRTARRRARRPAPRRPRSGASGRSRRTPRTGRSRRTERRDAASADAADAADPGAAAHRGPPRRADAVAASLRSRRGLRSKLARRRRRRRGGRAAAADEQPTPEGPAASGDASLVLAPADPAPGSAACPPSTPARRSTFRATVRNESQIVDNYDLAVLGLPEGWTAVSPAAAFLVPLGSGRGDSEQELRIDIAPPRDYRSTAGIWTFELVALSRTHATVAARAIAQFEVRPFQAWSVEVVPAVNSGRFKARYRTAVRNDGNAEQDAVARRDRRQRQAADRFARGRLTLEAGEVGADTLTVKPRIPKPVGRATEHRIGVDVVATEPEVEETRAGQGEARREGQAAGQGGRQGREGQRQGDALAAAADPSLQNLLREVQARPGHALAAARRPPTRRPADGRQVVFRQKPVIPLWLIGLVAAARDRRVLIYLLLPRKTTVPDARRRAELVRRREAPAREGSRPEPARPSARVDADADPGSVIEQSPAAGAKVDKDSTVSIVVADGDDKVAVPRLTGPDARQGRRAAARRRPRARRDAARRRARQLRRAQPDPRRAGWTSTAAPRCASSCASRRRRPSEKAAAEEEGGGREEGGGGQEGGRERDHRSRRSTTSRSPSTWRRSRSSG